MLSHIHGSVACFLFISRLFINYTLLEFLSEVKCEVLVSQLYLTICDLMDCIPPGSSVHSISQSRILKWVAMPSSRGCSWSRDQTHVSCIGRQILYHWATREALWKGKKQTFIGLGSPRRVPKQRLIPPCLTGTLSLCRGLGNVPPMWTRM